MEMNGNMANVNVNGTVPDQQIGANQINQQNQTPAPAAPEPEKVGFGKKLVNALKAIGKVAIPAGIGSIAALVTFKLFGKASTPVQPAQATQVAPLPQPALPMNPTPAPIPTVPIQTEILMPPAELQVPTTTTPLE